MNIIIILLFILVSALCAEPNLKDTHDWIVKYSNEYLKEGFNNRDAFFESYKIENSDKDCQLISKDSFFKMDEIDRSFDLYSILDFENAITQLILSGSEIIFYGNIKLILIRHGKTNEESVIAPHHIVKFKTEESAKRYFNAFDNLHNKCQKIQKNLY